jgi:WD40 repeat protein
MLMKGSPFVQCACFSPDGRLLASGCDGMTVEVWDITTRTLQRTFRHSNHASSPFFKKIMAVVFFPDGERVAASSNFHSDHKKAVTVWNVVTGDLHRIVDDPSTTRGGPVMVDVVALSPDCELVVSGPYILDETVKLWSMNTGALLHTLTGHSHWVGSVAASSDSKRVASGSDDQTVKVWDVATGALVHTFKGHSASVEAVAFSSDGILVASGSRDKTIKIWNASKRAHERVPEEHWNWIQSLSVSPDGKFVVSGSDDGIVRLWDTGTGALRYELEGHSAWVCGITFSHDGKRIASGSDDGSVRIWDAALGTLQQILQVHQPQSSYERRYRAIGFSPDDRLIAFATMKITIWDANTGAFHKNLRHLNGGMAGWVSTLAFSADGKRLVSGSCHANIEVKIWDVTTGALLGRHSGDRWLAGLLVSDYDSHSDVDDVESDYDSKSDHDGQSNHDNESGNHSKHDGKNKSNHGNESNHENNICHEKESDHDDKSSHESESDHDSGPDDITAVAFSTDGELMASATRSRTTTIKLWDTDTGTVQQSIEIGTAITRVSFSKSGPYLETDKGLVRISDPGNDMPPDQQPECNIFVADRWVVRDGENVLWLPPNYRVACVIVQSDVVVLGHASGRVTLLEFS